MPWYAVEALDDALDATKSLLTPLDARQWLKLALVVFFLGSAGGGGPSATAGSSTGGTADAPSGMPGAPVMPGGEVSLPFSLSEVFLVAIAVGAVFLLVGLLYGLVGSVMEFVFVETLRRQRVRIRQYADQHLGRALRLFAFRIALGLLVGVPTILGVLTAVSFAGGEPRISLGLVALLVPLILLLGLFAVILDHFTTNFVVPVMILNNEGVLSGWRRFWPTLRREWTQYGVYVVVRIGLWLAVGVLASVVGSIVGAVLFVPLAVVGALTLIVVGSPSTFLSNPLALLAVAAVLLVYVAVLTAALAVVFVPVQTYLRYHALLVLGDTERDFDLIPELRREVRERE